VEYIEYIVRHPFGPWTSEQALFDRLSMTPKVKTENFSKLSFRICHCLIFLFISDKGRLPAFVWSGWIPEPDYFPRYRMHWNARNFITSRKGIEHGYSPLGGRHLDIWTKFGTHLSAITINTPERSNSHKLKIQEGVGRHLEFRENVNNSGLVKDICIKLYGIMHHGHAEMTTWPKLETES